VAAGCKKFILEEQTLSTTVLRKVESQVFVCCAIDLHTNYHSKEFIIGISKNSPY